MKATYNGMGAFYSFERSNITDDFAVDCIKILMGRVDGKKLVVCEWNANEVTVGVSREFDPEFRMMMRFPARGNAKARTKEY